MYFKISCPHCKKSLTVREELSGRKCGCPHCGKTVQIPSLSVIGQATQGSRAKADIQIDTKAGAGTKQRAKQEVSTTYEDATNVSMLWSLLFGVIGTGVFYVVILLLRSFSWTEIFWDRGWVPYVTMLIFFWCIAILLLKMRKIQKQKQALLLDVLPTELSPEITFNSLDKFLDYIANLPAGGDSFLINRVVRGIEHFRVRKSTSETVTMMESQSDIDANNVSGSYTLVKVFIWALPIMGFIGTVIGISGAVAGLSGSLENANDVSAIKGALNDVFAGLGTAFDTTLLALVLSLMVKVPTSAMQKSEEDLITWVDEYCNENLLKRLNDKREGGAQRGMNGTGGVDPAVIREVFASAMGIYHEEWNKQVVEMNRATTEMQKSFEAITAQTEKLQLNAVKSNRTLQQHFAGLERGLDGLSTVLERLGEQNVVVQQVDKPKRGLFGFGRK
ncbi:MAG: MotA/TolQ/ExbB proton channel family protein [Planctomycetota bacterium]